MSLGVRGKLLLLLLAVHFAIGLAVAAVLWQQLRNRTLRAVELDVVQRAAAARDALESTQLLLVPASVDPLADRLGACLGLHVTVVDSAGTVVGDSEQEPAALEQLHGIGQAGAPGTAGPIPRVGGAPIVTSGREGISATAAFRVGSGHRGAVRAALSGREVGRRLDPARRAVLWSVFTGFLLAVGASVAIAQWVSQVLGALLARAGALARSTGADAAGALAQDELAGLAGALEQLAGGIERRVHDLAAERDRFAAVLDSMDEAVLALDATQRVTLANPAALRLLGPGANPLGRALVEATRAPALQELVDAAGGEEPKLAEFDLPGPTPRRVLVRAAPLRAAGGSVLVLHDVTELRRLETVRRDFVANVSHELRTPVSVIRANAETLQQGALDEPTLARAFVDGLVRNAERLAQLVADLLDISRIEAGQLPLQPREHLLLPALQRAAQAVEKGAAAKHLEVSVDCAEPLTAVADARALDQVLLNLVDNAVKYTPEGGHVVLRALLLPGTGVRIEVRDDGPGIAREHRERIFERFYRVDPGRSRDVGGTGLGLAIVRHLVAAMGGVVRIEPATPHGSVFWFTLPRQLDH